MTGVAPFVSFVRTLSKDWKEGRFDGSHQLYLLNGASRPWEFGYKEELNHFDAELPWFKYVPTVSRPWDHADWPGEIGRADDILRKYADSLGARRHEYDGLLVRASRYDREQQGYPEAARVRGQDGDQGRNLLGAGEVVLSAWYLVARKDALR